MYSHFRKLLKKKKSLHAKYRNMKPKNPHRKIVNIRGFYVNLSGSSGFLVLKWWIIAKLEKFASIKLLTGCIRMIEVSEEASKQKEKLVGEKIQLSTERKPSQQKCNFIRLVKTTYTPLPYWASNNPNC